MRRRGIVGQLFIMNFGILNSFPDLSPSAVNGTISDFNSRI